MKVLILEDDFKTRVPIFLEKLKSHDVTVVEHSADAIEKLKEETYDYIFLDHDLGGRQLDFDPEDCGTQVAEFIAANNIQKKSKIIIHSFNNTASERMLDIIKDNCVYIPGVWLQIK